jgi:hypothetical protein
VNVNKLFSCAILSIFLLSIVALSPSVFADEVVVDEFPYSQEYLVALEMYESFLLEKDTFESLGMGVARFGDLLLLVSSELNRLSDQEKIRFELSEGDLEELAPLDFKVLYNRLSEVEDLHFLALETRDEFVVLEDFLVSNNYLEDEATNNAFTRAKNSFLAERYEEALVHIDDARERASEYDALTTKVNALLQAGTRNIKSFFQRNWEWVLATLVALSIIGVILFKFIKRALLRKKLHQLHMRKKSIQELTKKIQHQYFSEGSLSENDYHIRLRVYGEMVRDIRRQIPLLEEELALQKSFFFKKSKQLRHSDEREISESDLRNRAVSKVDPSLKKERNKKV